MSFLLTVHSFRLAVAVCRRLSRPNWYAQLVLHISERRGSRLLFNRGEESLRLEATSIDRRLLYAKVSRKSS